MTVQRFRTRRFTRCPEPLLNIVGPETIPQLNEIITALETDEQVKVVVLDSAVDGFFLTHYNFLGRGRIAISS
jgi:enoyl-CoA hydratase/carnithine racemase